MAPQQTVKHTYQLVSDWIAINSMPCKMLSTTTLKTNEYSLKIDGWSRWFISF